VKIDKESFGAIGIKAAIRPSPIANVVGTFGDGSPAVVLRRYGAGRSLYVATCPGISYIKDAKFVPAELKENWPAVQREFINGPAVRAGVQRLVEFSAPVIEAGIYDAPAGPALILANFTYESIKSLKVTVRLPRLPKTVRSVSGKKLSFTTTSSGTRKPPPYPHTATFTLDLGLTGIVLME